MRIIREEVVTTGALTSNVALTETEWTAGTYTTGTQRRVGTDLYEVTASPSTTDEPTAGAALTVPSWVRVGKVNRWKMFSEFVAEQTIAASPLVVDIATSPTVNAVALFGVDASAAEIVTYTDGVETARVTRSLTNVLEVSNWFEYFFQPITRIEESVVLDLPSYGTDRIVVTITSDSGTVAVGKMVIGEQVTLGQTRLQFGAGIEDFSLKERDDFGGWTISERRFARRAEFGVMVKAARLSGVLRELASVRARPTVYIGDPDYPETIVIGFYKDAWATRQSPGYAEMTLEIEGLT